MSLLLAMSATSITVIVVIGILFLLFPCGWFKHLTGWPRDDDVDELKTVWGVLWSNPIMRVVSVVLQVLLAALILWMVFTAELPEDGSHDWNHGW